MILKELSDNQLKVFIDMAQIYDAFRVAYQKNHSNRGGMHWKKSKGNEYLFKTIDRLGNGKSLGPRNDNTENIFRAFHKKKKHDSEHLRNLKGKLKEQSRFCKAALIQRVPNIVIAILRHLDQQNLLGRNFIIVGTNALFAYEAYAGVFLEHQITATSDLDILWDTRPNLTLISDKKSNQSNFLDILQKADRSFEMMGKASFRAVNKNGYMVDLLKPMPSKIFIEEKSKIGGPEDLVAAEIMNIHWLLSSSKFHQTVIGMNGQPARMVVPDPRAFALHKLWLSKQDGREPVKKKRDRNQGIAVTRLVIEYLTQYRFKKPELKMLPEDIIKKVTDEKIPGLDFS